MKKKIKLDSEIYYEIAHRASGGRTFDGFYKSKKGNVYIIIKITDGFHRFYLMNFILPSEEMIKKIKLIKNSNKMKIYFKV